MDAEASGKSVKHIEQGGIAKIAGSTGDNSIHYGNLTGTEFLY
jgi:hypothetical protein